MIEPRHIIYGLADPLTGELRYVGKSTTGFWVNGDARLAQSRRKGGRPFVDQHGREFLSQQEAARALGISASHINQVLHGKRKSAGGLVFHFKENA